MGDHRADIEIRMTMHGKEYKQEWWINWSPDDDGCDRRITEWFAECWSDARARYESERFEAEREQREAAQEAQERATLARLKQKYE